MPYDWDSHEYYIAEGCNSTDCVCNSCWEDYPSLGVFVPIYLGFVSLFESVVIIAVIYLIYTQPNLQPLRLFVLIQLGCLAISVLSSQIGWILYGDPFCSQFLLRVPNLFILSTLATCTIQWRAIVASATKLQNSSRLINYRQAFLPVFFIALIFVLYIINYALHSPSILNNLLNLMTIGTILIFVISLVCYARELKSILGLNFSVAVNKVRNTVILCAASISIAIAGVVLNILVNW